MTNRHMKRFLIIRETQIKATMRYHVITVKRAVIKKSINNRYLQKCGVKEQLYVVGGNEN